MVVWQGHGGAAGEETPMPGRIPLLVYLVYLVYLMHGCQQQQFVEQLRGCQAYFFCLVLPAAVLSNGFPMVF